MKLRERCSQIELLVLDVDGVLTDGRVIYGDSGVEIKAFHVRDGSALVWWRQAGKQAAILSGRSSPTVATRAAELGIDAVAQGAGDKLLVFQALLAQQGLRPEQACYVGDDMPDVPVLGRCGLAVAVADACVEARALAHYVTRACGGRGAVRETIELVMHAQGLWSAVVSKYAASGTGTIQRCDST